MEWLVRNMFIQEGVVNQIDGKRVLIESESANGCITCAMNKKCMMSKDNKTCRIWANDNDIVLKKGDRVLLQFFDNYFLHISILLYLLPSIIIIITAVIGYFIAVTSNYDKDIFTAAGFILGFVFYIAFLTLFNKFKTEKNMPKVMEILKKRKINN